MTWIEALCLVWFIGFIVVSGLASRKIDHWYRRANLAEQQNAMLRKLVLDKTGMSAEMWWYADAGKVYIENPRSNIKITGLQT
jgi:hypothetical protein